MLEWMHDQDVVENLNANFKEKTKEDCEKFIKDAWSSTEKEIHLAIVDESDVYQGTVSLKNIDKDLKIAEFAISIRKTAMGTGISSSAMRKILNIGKEKLKLEKIYWCVSKKNIRAIKFYDKNKYKHTNAIPEEILSQYSNKIDLEWYVWRT